MRVVPDSMTDAWYAQAKVGDQRPVVRAIVYKQNLRRFPYDTAWAQGGAYNDDGRHRAGHFTSFLFGDTSAYREIRNIQTVEWERSVGQDAATCTLTFLNSEIAPIGSPKDNPTEPDEYDKPGYFTYNRGNTTIDDNRWGYTDDTGWNEALMPDMVVKTYEGYGHDPLVSPPSDANLVQAGTWMIDKVTYGADGSVTVEMRDLARLLLDSIVFPPAVPMSEYPLSWVRIATQNVPSRDVTGGAWEDRLNRWGKASSSNDLYVGQGLTNEPFAHYVSDTGGVDGHHASQAIMVHGGADTVHKSLSSNVAHLTTDKPHGIHIGDVVVVEGVGSGFNGVRTVSAVGSSTTLAYPSDHDDVDGTDLKDGHVSPSEDDLFWRSTGQDARNDFVWWEWDYTKGGTLPVNGIRLAMNGGPYRAYISIHNGTEWVGHHQIPYKVNGDAGSPGNVDIKAKIPFVKSVIADRFHHFDVVLKRVYNAKKIRITLTHLVEAAVGEHPYRGGLREFQIYTGDSLAFHQGNTLQVIGNYSDYTHIIKWVCAWAGWYWPPHATGEDFIRVQHGADEPPEKCYITYENNDPVLPNGRVWGDFMKTGTGGIADLTVDMFDKHPLMDIINYVRDLLGFIFFIDETGGAVWRMPNYWSLGNYLSPQNILDEDERSYPGNRGRYGRTDDIITLDENETLLAYNTLLNSSDIRDRIFVANAVGGIGIVIKGYNPNPVGLRRVAGWTDQHFATKREAKVMADMISAQQEFSYRTATATIPGYPAIQVDDQIRIFERVTNETFYHYVQGIKSSIDMTEGVWTYDLSTHWLGERPSDAWVVKVDELSNVTQQYLSAVGYSPADSEDNDSEPHSHGVG